MKKSILAIGLIFMSFGAESKMLFAADQHEEEWCLAQNIYFEARGSSLADQVAVADVVLNRVKSSRFPNTVCGVVRENRYPGKKNMCQFSWYCDGKSDWPKDMDSWANAQFLAWAMMQYGQYQGITEGSDHYHADYVNPDWAKDMHRVGQIGSHVFYRTK